MNKFLANLHDNVLPRLSLGAAVRALGLNVGVAVETGGNVVVHLGATVRALGLNVGVAVEARGNVVVVVVVEAGSYIIVEVCSNIIVVEACSLIVVVTEKYFK